MKIHEYKSQFGWPDDNGVGEQLIQQIIDGKKTATAGPKSLYSQAELADTLNCAGKPATVVDKNGKPRCNILITEVFETTFGLPNPRLVQGEGYGTDAEAFKQSHRTAWADLISSGKLALDDDTILIVELFHLL